MKNNYKIEVLSKRICESNIEKILDMLKLIPNSNYKREDILAENKEERVLYGKWEYSLVILNDKDIVGILIGYEREKEKSELYRENCFYINEIAISKKYKGQGLGKMLLETFIERVKKFKYLSGKIKIRIQTTNSIENRKVISLYESVGFKKIGVKQYPNKEDVVMEIEKKNNYK